MSKYCKFDDTPSWPCRWKGEPNTENCINCQLFTIKNTQYRLLKSFEETRISSFEKTFIETDGPPYPGSAYQYAQARTAHRYPHSTATPADRASTVSLRDSVSVLSRSRKRGNLGGWVGGRCQRRADNGGGHGGIPDPY